MRIKIITDANLPISREDIIQYVKMRTEWYKNVFSYCSAPLFSEYSIRIFKYEDSEELKKAYMKGDGDHLEDGLQLGFMESKLTKFHLHFCKTYKREEMTIYHELEHIAQYITGFSFKSYVGYEFRDYEIYAKYISNLMNGDKYEKLAYSDMLTYTIQKTEKLIEEYKDKEEYSKAVNYLREKTMYALDLTASIFL